MKLTPSPLFLSAATLVTLVAACADNQAVQVLAEKPSGSGTAGGGNGASGGIAALGGSSGAPSGGQAGDGVGGAGHAAGGGGPPAGEGGAAGGAGQPTETGGSSGHPGSAGEGGSGGASGGAGSAGKGGSSDPCGDVGGVQPGSPWPLRGRCSTRIARGAAAAAPTPKLVWNVPVGGNIPAIAADGTAYVITLVGNQLTALSPDGATKWQTPIGKGNFGSSPAIGVDGTVYVTTLDALYAIRPDGTPAFATPIASDGKLTSPLLGPDGTIYVASKLALEALGADGAKLWTLPLGDGPVSSPSLGHDGNLYVTTPTSLHSIQTNGALLWSRDVTTAQAAASVLIGVDGTVFVSSADSGGSIRAFATDGTPQWTTPLGGPLGNLALAPDGRILAVDAAGPRIHAVAPDGTPSEVWTLDSKWGLEPDLVVDAAGNAFVTSTGNELLGVVAGTPVSFGTICPGGKAKFVGVAMDADGALLVANGGNTCKVSMTGAPPSCPAGGTARVRVGNLIPDPGTVDVCVRPSPKGGSFQGPLFTCAAGSALSYGAIAAPVAIAPGNYDLKLVAGGDCNGPSLLDGTATFDAGTTTTVLSFGGAATGELPRLHSFRDDPAPSDNSVAIRFVNGVHQAGGPLDLGLTDTGTLPTNVNTPVFTGVPFASVSPENSGAVFPIDARGYALGVSALLQQFIGVSKNGKTAALFASTVDIAPANAAITLYVTGQVGSATYPLSAMLCNDGVDVGSLSSCMHL